MTVAWVLIAFFVGCGTGAAGMMRMHIKMQEHKEYME